jgi:hypothetical protein
VCSTCAQSFGQHFFEATTIPTQNKILKKKNPVLIVHKVLENIFWSKDNSPPHQKNPYKKKSLQKKSVLLVHNVSENVFLEEIAPQTKILKKKQKILFYLCTKFRKTFFWRTIAPQNKILKKQKIVFYLCTVLKNIFWSKDNSPRKKKNLFYLHAKFQNTIFLSNDNSPTK